MLGTLNPAQSAVVEAAVRSLAPGATARIVNYEDDFYRIHYSASGDSLLRIAVPYYPGWIAAVDGHPVDVLAVDYALSGVIVPAGEHQLEFRYHSRWFRMGAILSALMALICAGSFFVRRAR